MEALRIPPELETQLHRLETSLSNACSSSDASKIDADPLGQATTYQDASRLALTLAKVISHCAGKPLSSFHTYKSKLDKKEQKIHGARTRHERHLQSKRGQLTLGIDDANKIISNVKASKKGKASRGGNDKGKDDPQRPAKQARRAPKHKQLAFLDDLKNPT